MRFSALTSVALMLALNACLSDPDPKATETSAADTSEAEDTEPTETTTATDTEVALDTEVEVEVVEPPAPLALIMESMPTSVSVRNAEFLIGFGQAAGYLPNVLINLARPNENLIFGDTDIHEVFVGLSLFDIFHVWQDLTSPLITATGAAVVAMDKPWEFGSNGETMSGTTWITVHADGRTYIAFDFSVDFTAEQNTLVAYAALDRIRFTHVEAGNIVARLPSGNAVPGTPWMTSADGIPDYLCVRHEANGNVVGFINDQIMTAPTLTDRITEFADTEIAPPSIRLQHDFYNGGTPPGTYFGRFLLGFDNSSACGRISEWADAFRDPPRMQVAVGTLRTNSDGDSDHDGFNERGGYYTINAGTTTGRSVSFAVDERVQGLTLRIEGAEWAVPTITIDGSGETIHPGENVVWQEQGTNGGWIVFDMLVPPHTPIVVSW